MARFMTDKKHQDQESKKIIDRVQRESDIIGNSALVRTAERARDHLAAKDMDEKDDVEIWGTRVGRGLAVIAFVGLAIWLFNYLSRGG